MSQQRAQLKIYIEDIHAQMLDILAGQGLLGSSRTELMKRALVDFLMAQSQHNDALKKALNDSTKVSGGEE